jgi:hypothetical protein
LFQAVPIEFSLLNYTYSNFPINKLYPKPLHLNELKNVKFNKEAFDQINIKSILNQQDTLITSLIVDKTYEFVYTNKYLIFLITALILYCIFKYYKTRKSRLPIENIRLGYYPPTLTT